MNASLKSHWVFGTSAGHCAVAWTRRGIVRFMLPQPSVEECESDLLRRSPGTSVGTPPSDVLWLISAVQRYFDGEPIEFSDVRLDLDSQDEFFVQIYSALREIRWGQTTTYGALARSVGKGPQAARAVGVAMARNPMPLIIPCHRVLAAGDKLGGFSAPGGTATKRRMLELEGIRVGPPESPQQNLMF